MNQSQIVEEALVRHTRAVSLLHGVASQMLLLCQIVVKCLRAEGKIFFCGNGGSAADAQHLAAEFTGRFLRDREPYAAMALHCDTSTLTAIGNDYSFEDIYARPLHALGRRGDVLIGISTSGKSKNIIKALRIGKERGLYTVLLTGKKALQPPCCDLILRAPSDDTPRIQEMHILLGHILCELVEDSLCGEREDAAC